MPNVTTATIKLDAEVIVCKSLKGKILGYRAQMNDRWQDMLETQMYPTKAEALDALKAVVLESSRRNDPVVIYCKDLVGIGYYRPMYDWCYMIYSEQHNDQVSTCLHSGYTDKLDVTRALRRHMAAMTGGVHGGDLVLNPEDRQEYFRSEAWQAGCYFWRVSRNLELDDVNQDRRIDDLMREAGCLAQRRYSDLVRSGAPVDAAFITVRGELDGRYANGFPIAPYTQNEVATTMEAEEARRLQEQRNTETLKTLAAAGPIKATVGEPVPAGGLMRRLGIAAAAK